MGGIYVSFLSNFTDKILRLRRHYCLPLFPRKLSSHAVYQYARRWILATERGAEMNISNHAEIRMQQRGMLERDIQLVLDYGTETSDGIFLRRKDIKSAEHNLKKMLQRLNRLAGSYVVLDGENIVTAYRPDAWRAKRILAKS